MSQLRNKTKSKINGEQEATIVTDEAGLGDGGCYIQASRFPTTEPQNKPVPGSPGPLWHMQDCP
jgi:hypothetical protein